MRRPLIAGNWKMNLTHHEGAALVSALTERLRGSATVHGASNGGSDVEVVVCPPFTALAAVAAVLEASGWRLGLGAQDVHWEPRGPFTGEIAAPMLTALGCRYVIVGHSERRAHFGESDPVVSRKVAAALTAGLVPIICVGETLDQRRVGAAVTVVTEQLRAALAPLREGQVQGAIVVAYEPVWAIGTGEAAAPTDAQAMAAVIRSVLAEVKPELADTTRVLYGGSVQPDNCAPFFKEPDIDGALVGGASLRAETFLPIVEAMAR